MNLQHTYDRIFLLIALAACHVAAAQEARVPPAQEARIPPAQVTPTQESRKDSLQAIYNRYQSQAPQEKLFVHLDRSFYLAGETIWFRLYDIDAQSNRPVTFSGIAYIELLDRDNHAVLQTKVGLKEGKGDGAFSIPLSVPSGKFLFRAYTSWMRNFSPDFYYMQPLTIFNTLNDSTQPLQPTDSTHARIRLFPEGGNLVNGLTSIIAVEATDSHGKGVQTDISIIDQHKDTIAHFRTGLSGIGKFNFTPIPNTTCFAVTDIDQATITQPLPAGYDRGYVMHLEADGDHRIRITVHAAGQVQNPAVYLFAQTHSQMKAIQMNFLSAGQTTFYLDKDSLGDGISQLTLFDGDRIPVAERLYFKQPKQQLHIAVANLSSDYPPRSSIPINLSVTDNTGNPLQADLSMSVFRLDSLQSIPADNILTWLLLTSDLPTIANPASTVDWITNPTSTANVTANPTSTAVWITNPASAAALDDLMLTHGWSRFRWEDILSDRRPAFEFLPETSGPIINAKVIDKKNGQPPAPVIAYLSVPGQHFKLATARSQPDGSVFFHLDNFYGNRTLIAQTNSRTDSNCRLDVLSPWSERFATYPLPPVEYSAGWSGQLLQRTIDAQAENAYLTAPKHRYSPQGEDTVAFYGTADLRYNLDDFVRFVTIEEVIQEFVDNVKVRRKSGHAYFRVRNALFNLFFEDDPLLLLDGIPVFNPDKLVATDPAKIEKIDIVSHRYVLGPSVTDGIVSFRSYDGEFAGYELDPNAVAIQYNGLDRHREFYTPVYNAASKGLPSIPDFRNELLWAPNVLADTTGKVTLPLYTSDLKGKFALIVQGISKDGLAGYSMVTFSVGQ